MLTTGHSADQRKRVGIEKAAQGSVKKQGNAATMERFRSGELDQQLAEMTLEHGPGQYYDIEGNTSDNMRVQNSWSSEGNTGCDIFSATSAV